MFMFQINFILTTNIESYLCTSVCQRKPLDLTALPYAKSKSAALIEILGDDD